jgi:CBS-domain-containing membrane protein
VVIAVPSWWRKRPAPPRRAECIEDVATPTLVTVERTTPAASALHVAETCGVRHLLVVERAELLGVLCTCDLTECDPATPVGRRMSIPPITISGSAPPDLALTVMRAHGVACLPVLRQGSLTGIVTRRDLRAAGLDLAEPRCAKCGGSRHVRSAAGTGLPTCIRCLAAG